MNMRMTAALILGLAAPAAANPALECLEISARSEGLRACLGESRGEAAPPVAVGVAPALAPALNAAAAAKPAPRRVPTPTGWRDGENGTLEVGFFKGLDSGFKTAAAAILSPAVVGLEAAGAPYRDSAAGYFFTGLGLLLAIPASVVGALVGAPIGAAAGMIAEKVSPGSTKGWFTF